VPKAKGGFPVSEIAGGSGKRRLSAVFCGVCGACVATMRLAEVRQMSAVCPPCRETMRRLGVVQRRKAE